MERRGRRSRAGRPERGESQSIAAGVAAGTTGMRRESTLPAHHGTGLNNSSGVALSGTSRRGTAFWELMPFLEQADLYQRAGGDLYYGLSGPRPYARTAIGLLCGTDMRATAYGTNWLYTNYAINFQVAGRPEYGDNVNGTSCSNSNSYVNEDPTQSNMTPSIDMVRLYTDGTSKTIVFGERYRNCRSDNGW